MKPKEFAEAMLYGVVATGLPIAALDMRVAHYATEQEMALYAVVLFSSLAAAQTLGIVASVAAYVLIDKNDGGGSDENGGNSSFS